MNDKKMRKGRRLFKKAGAVLLAAILCAGVLNGCGKSGEKQEKKQTEVIVFAAASMTETLEQIAAEYQKLHPEIRIIFNFDSSGTLKTQIEEGAACDLFISAAPKQMNQLEESGLVKAGTRIDLLENKVVLAISEQSSAQITSFDELAAHLKSGDILFVMGNEDVPVGQYTQKILQYYGIDEKQTADKGIISYAGNVKEVTTQITEGLADCGVIYQTDAYSAGLAVTDTATEEMCGRVIYPAAVLENAVSGKEAGAFLTYLTGDTSRNIFESVGFTALTE